MQHFTSPDSEHRPEGRRMGGKRILAGKRMLITGASQGIGRALAEAAARRGAKLILVARSPELQNLAASLAKAGAEVEAVNADITKPEDRHRIFDGTVRRFGGLDILVNNAGIGATGHFVEANEERLRKIMEVNFFGLTEVTRHAIPLLKNGDQPLIVNISSIAGKRAIPARSEYSASKFAVEGFTQALRGEMVRFGIDVLSVCPGLTATNFSQNMIEQKARVQLDHMRSMSAEEVAEAALRAMEKGKTEIVLTFKGKLLVTLSRLMPRLVDRLVARRVRKVFADELAARKA